MKTIKRCWVFSLIGLVLLGFTGPGMAQARSTVKLASNLADDSMIPLTDMGSSTYLGFSGGLYADGSNLMPAEHAKIGHAFARGILPRDIDGNPDPNGKYVLLSVGMSNTTQEFCHEVPGGDGCNPWTFGGQAASDDSVNHSTLEIVDGAAGGQTAYLWVSPDDYNYDRVRDDVLAPKNLSESQVEIVWIKQADGDPGLTYPSLPDPTADAYHLEGELGDIVRALHERYPNLKQVFFSSRIYGGYATRKLNPEPFAYESGYSVKWLVQAQIDQIQTGQIDPTAGDLDYHGVAPWVAWGAYLWADGATPRSDGLVWLPEDFEADYTHPSTLGETKVGTLLLNFFKTSDQTTCWFLAGKNCQTSSVFLPLISR
jgi:hypothetical protein